MIGLIYLMSWRIIVRIAFSLLTPVAMSPSTLRLKSVSASATAVFSVSIALAQFASLPTARNSKRFPVKAKGDVRLRSVLSISSSGMAGISSLNDFFPLILKASSSAFSTCSRRSVTVRPRNDDMMAGGASLAPSRWAFEALIILAFSSPLWSSTAFRVSTVKTTKRKLSSGVFPGACSSTPVLVARLQLLCFPLPFTPLKGFSCNRQRNPCFLATRFMMLMSNML